MGSLSLISQLKFDIRGSVQVVCKMLFLKLIFFLLLY